MKREPKIEELLNAAQEIAVRAHLGQPVIESVLAGMAFAARAAVYAQADAGMWGEFGVLDSDALRGLEVRFARNPVQILAIGDGTWRPLRCEWNFKSTVLRFLETAVT